MLLLLLLLLMMMMMVVLLHVVVGGRSRLHLIDLGSCSRSRDAGLLSLTSLGAVITALLSGQRHPPCRSVIDYLLKCCWWYDLVVEDQEAISLSRHCETSLKQSRQIIEPLCIILL